jgi:hypothetical protein
VNVEELFNFSRLHVNDMASILKDLDMVGSTTGLTIKNIKDRYNNYSVEGTFVWVTRWVVIGLSVLGLGGIFWCLLRRYKKAKKDHQPILKRFRNLFTTDNLPRDQDMQERGGLEEDSDNEDASHMIPDDMQRGPVPGQTLALVLVPASTNMIVKFCFLLNHRLGYFDTMWNS